MRTTRLDIFDRTFHIVLRGTTPSDLVPVDEWLDSGLIAKIDEIIRAHDFDRRPVASGFYGNMHEWRVSAVAGSPYFAMLVSDVRAERSVRRSRSRSSARLRLRARGLIRPT